MSTYAAPAARHSAAYKQSAILTASPGQLVVMLYDGARRFLFQAKAAMSEEDHARAAERMHRAEAILDELQATLDLSQGKLASDLQGLYVFFRRQLGEARAERDPDKVDWVWQQLGELREAWAQIAAQAPLQATG